MVVLDRLRPGDEAAHLAGEDEEQARRLGWWPRRSGPEQFRRMLAADDAEWRTGGPRLRLAVRVGDVLVGGCELRLVGAGIARVSYWTFPPQRRRGYASRALCLLARWASSDLHVARLEAHVDADNAASLATALRAGFEPTERVDEDGRVVYEART